MNKIQAFLQKIIGIKQEKPPKVIPFTPQSAYGLPEPAPLDQKAQIETYQFSWVYACIKKIAAEFANLNLLLYNRKSESEVEEIKSHDVLDLLDTVNNYMTRYDLFEWTSTMWEASGECFWWKIRDSKGKIISIYPYLIPSNMTVVPSEETFVKGYVYSVPGTSKQIPFDAKDIIHFRYPNPTNPYRGLSPIKAAEYAIGTDKQAAKWNYNFFKNSAKPFGVILYPGTMSQATYDRVKTQWEAGHGGVENAHKVAILEGVDPSGKQKVDFKEIGFGQRDMDFVEQRRFSRDEIFTIFGIPKGIMIAEDVNRAVAQTHESVFIKNTMVPKFQKFVSYLNEFLLPEYEPEGLFFDFEDPTIRDIEATLKYYESALRNGWMSPNEVREEEGLPPFKGGESIYLPSTMLPIGEAPAKKKERKLNVRRQRRTTPEKVSERVKEHLKELTKSIFNNQKKKKKGVKQFTAEFKEKYLNNYIKRANREESQFRSHLRKFFKKQEDRVLKTIKEAKEVSVRFDIPTETKLAIKAFEPIIINLIKEHGEDTMELLGLTGFEMTTERIERFLKKEGLKFAKEMNKTTKAKILKQIAQGMEAGESIPEIRDRIREVFREARTSRAAKIARTEVARASNFGTVEAYKQSGVVRAKEWLTTPDERLCPYCAAMDGKIVDLDKNFFNRGDSFMGDADKPLNIDYSNVSHPPLHANCRCTLIPVLIKSANIRQKKKILKIKEKIKKEVKEEVSKELLKDTLEVIKEIQKNG